MEVRIPIFRALIPLCAAVFLAACGGGDDVAAAPPVPVAPTPTPPPPPPPPVGVGTAGGTVTHTAGASVVIPAGALTQNVVIEIAQSSAGAPPLPAGVTSAGSVFAFTPHGTTFAVPVTVTVPFDPSLMPAGATLALYKTNAAQTAYEPVTGAVVSGNSLVGEVTSFSFLTTGTVVPPIALTGPPVRVWTFSEFRGDTLQPFLVATGGDLGPNTGPMLPLGDIQEFYDFGPAFFDPPIQGVSPDAIATGDIASFADGITYWVGTSAPVGITFIAEDPIGSVAELVQFQTYIKNAADASYSFTLTAAITEGFDGNGTLGRICPAERVTPHLDLSGPFCDLIGAVVSLDVSAGKESLPNNGLKIFSNIAGGLSLRGSAGDWSEGYWNESYATSPLFFGGLELVSSSEDFRGPDGHATFRLSQPRTYSLDLSSVGVNERFVVAIIARAKTYNRANSPVSFQGAEFETAANAFLRDPVTFGGTSVTIAGLTPVETTLPLPTLVREPVEPAACVPGPGPDPAAGQIQFNAATYSLDESSNTPTITVSRTGGSLGAVTATIATSNGSAAAGVDYISVNSSVFFGNGDVTPREVSLQAINDLIDEPDKTVNLTLSQPGGCAALGAQTTAVLTIRDDEVTPQTLFTVGGTVTGLTANSTSGRGLLLTDHHGLSLTILGDGPFTFTNLPSPTGTAYLVRVEIQPLAFGNVVAKRCAVTNGSGIFANANVTNVQVTCTDP